MFITNTITTNNNSIFFISHNNIAVTHALQYLVICNECEESAKIVMYNILHIYEHFNVYKPKRRYEACSSEIVH